LNFKQDIIIFVLRSSVEFKSNTTRRINSYAIFNLVCHFQSRIKSRVLKHVWARTFMYSLDDEIP